LFPKTVFLGTQFLTNLLKTVKPSVSSLSSVKYSSFFIAKTLNLS
jgi:hypothetical protein